MTYHIGNQEKRKLRKKVVIPIFIILIIGLVIGILFIKNYLETKKQEEIKLQQEMVIKEIESHYSQYVMVKKDTILYKLDDNNNYYVPVSYVINEVDDKVDVVIENLKTNISMDGTLSSHLNYHVELMNYELDENIINMNFNNVLLDSVYDGKLKEEVKYAIFYSLRDTIGVEEVFFSVNSEEIEHFVLEN